MFKQKSEAEHYANLLRSIVLEGGKLAKEMRGKAPVEEKADRSLVTAADLAVTALVKDRLAVMLKQENHVLIDEESLDDLPPVEEALAYDYQWVLDPIDGTAPYSAGLAEYAVSLGLMHHGKPWLGAVYLPEGDELYWTDGLGNVLKQKGASGGAMPEKMVLMHAPVFEGTPYFLEMLNSNYPDAFEPKGYMVRSGGAVIGATKAMNSFGLGYVGKSKVWDQAATMALAQTLGLSIVKVLTNEKFEKFDSTFLDAEYRLAEPIMFATEKNVEILRKKLMK